MEVYSVYRRLFADSDLECRTPGFRLKLIGGPHAYATAGSAVSHVLVEGDHAMRAFCSKMATLSGSRKFSIKLYGASDAITLAKEFANRVAYLKHMYELEGSRVIDEPLMDFYTPTVEASDRNAGSWQAPGSEAAALCYFQIQNLMMRR